MSVRVGVVGATGFIGQHTCATLSHMVDEVVAVTAPRLSTSARSLPELTAEIARCVGGHEKLPGDGHEVARWRT